MRTGQTAGVWGGLSADERRAIRLRDRVELLLPRGMRVARGIDAVTTESAVLAQPDLRLDTT
jgi:hypothetical protein